MPNKTIKFEIDKNSLSLDKKRTCRSPTSRLNNMKVACRKSGFTILRLRSGSKTLSWSKGFTIVELLVVIVVIGILAGITIVSYSGIRQRANLTTLQSDLKNASTQLEVYKTTNDDSYPANTDLAGVKASSGTVFAYTRSSATSYCIAATNNSVTYHINSSDKTITSGACTLTGPDWITIGTQTWAKYNLNVGTRIDGTVEQTNNGGTNIVEKYCYNNDEANCTTYGGLYQWDEAMQYVTTEGAQGVCPAGSHIPTDNDWKILEMQLGMTQEQADISYDWRGTDQGTQLKSGGSSGLNVPLAGARLPAGSLGGLSSIAYLWSSSESGGSAWGHYLNSGGATVGRSPIVKAYGSSVRCLGN